MLEIKNLYAEIDNKKILNGINLSVKAGEVHAIMGLNGSGKSTLTQIIAGHSGYKVTKGDVIYKGKNLLDLEPEIRAREGIFVAFQYPVEIEGINNGYFLRTSLNAIKKHRGEEELDPMDFQMLVKKKIKDIGINPSMLERSINKGFSGGEKKRNEILQMSLLEPSLTILDETDSGLDIDALKIVAEGVNRYRSPKNAIIIITHYQRLLNYIKPDYVHVLLDGKIAKSGGWDLALKLEDEGYDWINSSNNKTEK